MLNKPCTVYFLVSADTVDYLHDAHEQGKRILIEGANATMLDVDHGTYPFVTSSNPSIGGIVTGLGMAPTKFEAIIGVVSCYLACYFVISW
jgi:adenylosuccinate synthase